MKNTLVLFFFTALLLEACITPYRTVTYMVATRPVYTISPAPQKILLINSCDICAKKFRENKEQLFVSITDDLLDSAAKRIAQKTGISTQPLYGFTNITGNTDSLLTALLLEKNATHAIVISAFDVYFSQTHVEVTKDPNSKSKSRQAFYDIVSDIHFRFYNRDSLIKTMELLTARYHSSRSVASGLLSVGPNVVVQEKDARSISLDNLQQYLNYFFPGQKPRTRTFLGEKGFENMLAAIDKKDYETALLEARLLSTNASKNKAALACYDCAILYEMKGETARALDYLHMALNNYPLQPAYAMLKELEP